MNQTGTQQDPSTSILTTGDQIETLVRAQTFERCVVGLGCFWSPDARFGAMDGIVQTRVGYAGGTEPNPTYKEIGRHAEVVRITFDPKQISYRALLESFGSPDRLLRGAGQYRGLVAATTTSQWNTVLEVFGLTASTADPHVLRADDPRSTFWPAEDYHQKYRLRRNQRMVEMLERGFGDDWDQSAAATKLNAAAAGLIDGSTVLQGLI